MNERMVLKLLKAMMKNNIPLRYTNHAMKRMYERNITTDDIIHILNNASSVKKETESIGYAGKYNYKVVSNGIDKSVVVSLYFDVARQSITVITVIN